eukprot:TRINITY_DN698_c1_g2_i1.p1 TRINITY_DN698_c1_g2~~TRINITY_DN698_c1_g2_i1.p1  ORF type:complete len:718 (+),score=175.93 TRINITY_DN698_c1_g2_i1:80-2155(+)
MKQFALLAATTAAASAANMNGEYIIGNPNKLSKNKYSTEYTDEYFTVYSPPIRTRYSQVFWTMMDPVPLPDEIVNRFDGKVMAMTGYEVDQVFRTPQGDKSVPIYWAYNHHYCAWLLSNKTARMEKLPETDYSYGHPLDWHVVDDSQSEYPTNQVISEGNGGEFRKSYHGYPRKFAQLLQSPTTFHITPMQIDTHNRFYNGTGFKAGILPKESEAPPNASYSGLLECPCTTRNKKVITPNYNMCDGGSSHPVVNAEQCFAAGTGVGVFGAKNVSTSDTTVPVGCSISADKKTVTYNNATHGASCSASGAVSGVMSALVKMSATVSGGMVNLTLTGPSDKWFGVGFNARAMSDTPYAIIVNGTGDVMERRLANHAPGTQLASSVTILSSSVSGGLRTVILQRKAVGKTSEHFTFPQSASTVNMINAIGTTGTFEMHAEKGLALLALLNEEATTCICEGTPTGTIGGIGFSKHCAAEPVGDLLRQKNPTCFLDTYAGGLHCCHHEWFLLDANQNVPEPVDEYHLKFRFYFQDFEPETPSHTNLERFYFQTEAYAGEYDVPKCKENEECVHSITAHFTPKMMTGNVAKNSTGMQLMYAGGHCHAPSCISMELYNADTGDLLCRQAPVFGDGDEIFNEKGYIAIPPCLWGSEEDGLEPPVFLPWNANLTSIKKNNNTNGHYGEMASWQTRGVTVY